MGNWFVVCVVHRDRLARRQNIVKISKNKPRMMARAVAMLLRRWALKKNSRKMTGAMRILKNHEWTRIREWGNESRNKSWPFRFISMIRASKLYDPDHDLESLARNSA